MKRPKILYLRAFMSPNVSAAELVEVYKAVSPIADLIVLPNLDEEKRFLAELKLTSAEGIQFSEATNDDWQAVVSKLIYSSDLIIYYLNASERDIPDISSPKWTEGTEYEPVSRSPFGPGLLREIEHCERLGAANKVVVLAPRRLAGFLDELWKNIDLVKTKYSRSVLWVRSGDKLLSPILNLSEVDLHLSKLRNFRRLIFVDLINSTELRICIMEELPKVGELKPNSVHEIASEPIICGIPGKPVHLPPDGKLKHLRFTPVEHINRLPPGEIVELSEFEATQILERYSAPDYCCGWCRGPKDRLFWYQDGLEPKVDKSAAVYYKCQSCGRKGW